MDDTGRAFVLVSRAGCPGQVKMRPPFKKNRKIIIIGIGGICMCNDNATSALGADRIRELAVEKALG
jgi:hypothetical protein